MRVLINLKSQLFSELLYNFLISNDEIIPIIAGNEKNETFDIIITDYHGLNTKISTRYPASKILLIDTGLNQNEIISTLTFYNIRGIISPNTNLNLFKKALNVINKGQIWFSNNLVDLLLNYERLAKTGHINITDKENKIINLVCEGYNNKEIALKMFISEHTVKAHLNRIFKKLNIANRQQLMKIFLTKPS